MDTIRKVKKVFTECRSRSMLTACLMLSLLLASCNIPFAPPAHTNTNTRYQSEIIWDNWGVPHIYGKDSASLFYAFGEAQMESHANLLLNLYGQARGRAAEYWGNQYVKSDEVVRTMGFPDHAQQWYAAQHPEFRHYIDAFVAGLNNYAQQHLNHIAPEDRVVLPVRVTDVFAHLQRILFLFLLDNNSCDNVGPPAGSNAWAIAPSHSTDGKAMLLANPHLPWSGLYTLYEAQLVAPGINAYGAALVGLPVLFFAFNDNLSWAHTINTFNGCDLYQLTLSGNGYLFDGQVRAFETQTQTLLVRQPDGTVQKQPFVVRRAIQGPVVQANGQLLAMRIVGVGQFPASSALQEWWDMARAKNLAEFEAALQRLQIPMFTVIYADRDGHIFSFFNGEEPIRLAGATSFWSGPLAGNTSSTLWTNIHPYADLPMVIDPSSGWVQNSNSPPWVTTFPPMLDPNHYPPYIAPRSMSLREQGGVDMLTADKRLSFEQMIQDKFSTHVELADRVVDDLIAAARLYGNSRVNSAADVLQAWDRNTNANSRGAVLFYQWWLEMQNQSPGPFAIPWSEKKPRTTPTGLASPLVAVAKLDTAAAYVQSHFGALNVPWGDIFRLQWGKLDFPASGGPGDPFGIFRALYFNPTGDGHFAVNDGDTYIAAVEFTQPVRAMVLLTYGNSSQPGSPHNGDQLTLYAHNALRPALLTRAEVEARATSYEVIDSAVY